MRYSLGDAYITVLLCHQPSLTTWCVLPQVLGLLDEMQREGVEPDEVTTAAFIQRADVWYIALTPFVLWCAVIVCGGLCCLLLLLLLLLKIEAFQ